MKKGFTLLEVLVALMLASMVTLVVGTSYAFVMRAMIISERMIQAQGIAERALITAHAQPCAYLGRRDETIVDEGRTFRRIIEVTSTPAVRLWRFESIVSWQQWGRWYTAPLRIYEQADYTCP